MTYTSSPATVNERALELRARGSMPEAIEAFRQGIARFPGEIALHQNLAQLLYETGDTAGAIAEHRAALDIDPESIASHMALYELLQVTGEKAASHAHQMRALERQRLFSSIAPHEKRRVLMLAAPGDWQANIPVDFLIDRDTTTVHKLYLLDAAHLQRERLPDYDVAWNTIAESPDAIPYLALAQMFLGSQPRPSLNEPGRVLTTSRILLPHTLGGSQAVVPPVAEVSKSVLAAGAIPLGYPLVVRPVGSHAGEGLERIEFPDELPQYVERHSAERYFISPFIEYRSRDGFFRKYRVVFVDGTPYPVHLAISSNWMIHYYNAPMAENAWMRNEEAAFLSDLSSVFEGPLYDALVEIATGVSLDYFGIDCAIGQDGHVLVFEADPAMLVHTSDPVDLYPYKQHYVPRIYRALEAMIDRRKVANT